MLIQGTLLWRRRTQNIVKKENFCECLSTPKLGPYDNLQAADGGVCIFVAAWEVLSCAPDPLLKICVSFFQLQGHYFRKEFA